MKKRNNIFLPNINSFSYFQDYGDYTLFISQVPSYKGIIQIRDRDGVRFLGYCSKYSLQEKIRSLDTLFTFYN